MSTDNIKRISKDDCIKAAMVILESLTAKGLPFEQQVYLTCSMLSILQASHVNTELYLQMESKSRSLAQTDMENLFGVEKK